MRGSNSQWFAKKIAEQFKDDLVTMIAEQFDVDELTELVREEIDFELLAKSMAEDMKSTIVTELAQVVKDEIGELIDTDEVIDLVI